MQNKISLEKKHLYFLTAIILAVIGISYVIAYGGTSPAKDGHSAGELELTPLYNDAVNGNGGNGTTNPTTKLEVSGGPIKATGGLVIETRASDPANPETGRMWLITS